MIKFNKNIWFFLFCFGPITATVWQADDFFGDWMQWQHCYHQQTFFSMNDHLNDAYFLHGFKTKFLKHKQELTPLIPFLSQFCSGLVTCNGDLNYDSGMDEYRDKLKHVYEWLDSDPGKLLSYLKNDPLFNNEDANKFEKNADINVVINKYKSFAKLLFACQNNSLRGEYLFSLADQLFKWGFSSEHWNEFKNYFEDPQSHPVARFACSIIWNYLVGRGWKDWSNKTLENLKEKTKHGAKVFYIAGGTDILQLLRNEIYNIHIVDPFLPTQGRYYSDTFWERWIKGTGKNCGIGDTVVFDFSGKKLKMIRYNFKRMGEFVAKLSTGETVNLEKSITEWRVMNAHEKIIGSIIFDRRFASQKDFVTCKTNKKRVLLMSFNEMYYAFQPTTNGGWGMNLSSLSKDFNLYVKQLTFPVNKNYLKTINESEEIKFDFIKLGSCAT